MAINRREFIQRACGGLFLPLAARLRLKAGLDSTETRDLFWIHDIPEDPLQGNFSGNIHVGVDSLLHLMAERGLMFHRTASRSPWGGPNGLIGPEDVVLIKVNAQWKYRGCTNSDVIRGLIQRILDHPDVFTGEVVIFENGQGRGSLNCDTHAEYPDDDVHANANDESHSFLYLVDHVFRDPRVSAYLLDPIRRTFIDEDDHRRDGYRRLGNVSYPCFTTAGGRRVELREGLWSGSEHHPRLKLINVPVLKHHGGSEVTASLKHLYGILSMDDGWGAFRHYNGLGETCGMMMASVLPPVLNILDAVWISHRSLGGYPADTTFRANTLAASQDPVALDAWAIPHLLYPIDHNPRHHTDNPKIQAWLQQGRRTINDLGGLRLPDGSIRLPRVTDDPSLLDIQKRRAGYHIQAAFFRSSVVAVSFRSFSKSSVLQHQTFDILNAGAGPLRWTVRATVPWLVCTPDSGISDCRVTVRFNPEGLPLGTHFGALLFSSPNALNSPFSVDVRAVIGDGTRHHPDNDRLEF
jgi:hypothetical protein